MSETFLTLYRRDRWHRLLDLSLHVLAAGLLPGPMWLQWLPDVLVPVVFMRSLLTGTLLPDSDLMLRWHRGLHLRGPALVPVAALFIAMAVYPAFMLHFVVHMIIDAHTHGEGWL